MKKSLLSLSFAFCAISAAAAGSPQDLPDGITVSPAQGIVDVSGSANPRGVTEITFTFPSRPELNPSATGNFCIYVDGSDTPAEELPVTGNASVDPMQSTLGGFTFKHVYRDPGKYTITVPEGVWIYDETKSPEMTLDYEIVPGVESYPAAGAVAELMEISLSVPGVDRLSVHADKIQFFTNAGDIAFNAVADGDEVFITPKNLDDVSADDTYTLFLGAGALTWDEGEKVVSCFETLFTYVKTDIPKPAISPAEGAVEAFGNFTVTFPEGFKLSFIDDMSVSCLYPEENGKMLGDPALRYRVRNNEGKAEFYPVDNEGEEIAEPVKLDAGAYVFCPAASYAFGEWKDKGFVSIPPYIYSFRVETAVNPGNCFVKGTVTLPSGAPAVGAGVVITDGDAYYEYAVSGANGEYVVSNVPSDPTATFYINAFDADYQYYYRASTTFDKTKNNVYDIAFVEEPDDDFELNVTVTDEEGAYVSGALVNVNKTDESATTDDFGVCHFTIPSETGMGRLSVTVSKEGYEEKTEDITWTDGEKVMDVTVEIKKIGGGVAGIITDADAVYYNLQGERIEAPHPGQVVIRVVNGKASKIVSKGL